MPLTSTNKLLYLYHIKMSLEHERGDFSNTAKKMPLTGDCTHTTQYICCLPYVVVKQFDYLKKEQSFI